MNQTTTNQTPTNQTTNQTPVAGLTNQAVMPQTAQASQAPQASSMQGQNTAQMQNSQFSQIIQQVAELKQSLHDFIDQEDFPDARVIAASGMLEGELSRYHQLAVEKENQKPGLETF